MTARRVVVVDSGVDAAHPALRGVPVQRGPAFAAHGAIDDPEREADLLGHGTAVAAVIARTLPAGSDVAIDALRVFFREPACAFEAVLHAIAHALTLQPAVINLSLGTTSLRHRGRLQELVAAAARQGTRIVAPASYGGLPCDPGSLPGVEAVVGDPNVLPQVPELRPHGGRLVWFASPLPPADADGVRRLRARGESLACASVTACLLRAALR